MGGVKNGALTVLIGGKVHLSILNCSELDVAFDMPANLEVEFKPNLFSLNSLVDHICSFLKTNASLTRLGEQTRLIRRMRAESSSSWRSRIWQRR